MASIQGLSVILSAQTTKFSKGMDKARADLKRFTASASKAEKINKALKLSFFAVGAAATASFAALTIVINRNLQSLDRLGKTADKLGVTTEALGALRFAAEQTGVESKTLDTALQRLTRRLSEAAKGGGPAAKALQELGLDAAQLSTLPVDQAMLRIADAMERVKNQSDRVRLAFALFDSEGVALVNTLKGGSKSLDNFRKEAEKLGVLVSRQDVAKIEKFNDNLNKLKKAIAGFGQQLTIAFAEDMEQVADSMAKAAENSGGFARNLRDVYHEMTRVLKPGKVMTRMMRDILGQRSDMDDLRALAFPDFNDPEKGVLQVNVALDFVGKKAMETTKEIHRLYGVIERMKNSPFDILNIRLVQLQLNKLKETRTELLEIMATLRKSKEGTENRARAEALGDFINNAKKLKTFAEGVAGEAGKNVSDYVKRLFTGAAKQISEESDRAMDKMLEKAQRAEKQLSFMAEQVGKKYMEAFSESLMNQNGNGQLKGFFQAIERDLQGHFLNPKNFKADQLALNLAYIQRIMDAIETTGVTGDVLEVIKLLKEGGNIATASRALQGLKEIKNLEKRNKMHDRARSIVESLKTNQQRLVEFEQELNTLKKAGLLSEEQVNKALAKRKEELKEIRQLQLGGELNNNLRNIGFSQKPKPVVNDFFGGAALGGAAANRGRKQAVMVDGWKEYVALFKEFMKQNALKGANYA